MWKPIYLSKQTSSSTCKSFWTTWPHSFGQYARIGLISMWERSNVARAILGMHCHFEKIFLVSPDSITTVMETEHFVFITQPSLNPSDSMKGCIASSSTAKGPLVWKDAVLCSVVCTICSNATDSSMSKSLCLPVFFTWKWKILTIHNSTPKKCDGCLMEDCDILSRPRGTLGFQMFSEIFWLRFPLKFSCKLKSMIES